MSTCPSCKENMEKGYVIGSGGAIFWSEKPRKWTTFGFEHLVLASPIISQANVEGYRCSKCKIILFSYEKKERDQRRESARAPVALIILVIGLILGLIYVLAGS